MGTLAEPITALAYRAANGELAWRRADIPAALAAIAESEQAILGGEVWMALGEGRWVGLIPSALDGPPAVWHWDTTPRAASESWPAYCIRAAEESARVVTEMGVEEESALAVRNQLFFNLSYVTEDEADQ